MARNTLRLELSGFKELLTKLDKLGGDVPGMVEGALMQASGTIADDTLAALANANLPAGGKFSVGDTKAAVVIGKPTYSPFFAVFVACNILK